MTVRHAMMLASLVLGVGCGRPAPLPDDALVDVVAALHLFEARQTVLRDVPPSVRDSVLALHGLTPDEWTRRLEELATSPVATDSLYARVQARLQQRRDHTAADSLSR